MSNISSSNSQGVRVPKLRFPGFEGEWESSSLGEVGTFTKGAPLSKADISEEGTPFILYGELYTTYNEVTNAIVRKTDKEVDSSQYSRVGDVIIPTSGETPEEIATATCVMLPNVILAGDLNIFRSTKVDGRIISYIINHIVNQDISRVAQGKSVVHIKADELSKIRINYPNSEEQKKLIRFLENLSARIEKQQQLVEALKSYKRGVANRIFRDMYDSSWRTICLGDICSITMGQSPDSSSYNTDGIGLPLVQGNADITNGITTPLRYTSNPTKVCESGSIILSVRAPVGTVSRANQRVCLGRGVCAITSSNTDFIYQLLLCYQDSWKRIEQGGTFTAISGDDISSFSVSVPDCELQNRIAVFLSQFDTKIRDEDIILQSLQKQKLALLQQLFI